MLSIDWYGYGEEFNRDVDKALAFMAHLAEQKLKLHALSECGPLSSDLQKIIAKYKSSYILTWRNAPPRDDQKFIPPTPEQLAQVPEEARKAYESWLKMPKPEELLKEMKADIQNIK
jgi:mannan endo-1,4-beta-mannosidase